MTAQSTDQPQEKSSNTIVSVVVHDLVKNEGVFTVDPRDEQLTVTGTVQRLVDELSDTYAKRAGKSHGRFEDDEENFPVKKYVREHFVTRESGFYELSILMMNTLATKASKTAATGGHVFICHITRDKKEFLYVAILTEELGAALTADKDVEDSLYLDINGFRLAGRIDITSWTDGSERYLSFIKGRKQDKVSEYFKAFLGCNSNIVAATESNTLIAALESFATSKAFNEEERDAFFTKAHMICYDLANKDEPLHIEPFANELWPSDPLELVEVLSSPDIKLTEGFVPDKRVLRRLVKFSGKTKQWKIEFTRTAIQEGQIIFNEDETLTIRDLPKDLLVRLRKEIQPESEIDE